MLALASASSTAAATASVQYTYDGVGRIATALYGNGVCIAYIYDANGNRTAQTNSAGGAPESPMWGSGVWGCFPWTARGSHMIRAAAALPARRPAPIQRRGR